MLNFNKELEIRKSLLKQFLNFPLKKIIIIIIHLFSYDADFVLVNNFVRRSNLLISFNPILIIGIRVLMILFLTVWPSL